MVNEIEPGPELNATQLDAQRARHLLDRALGMSERDDIAGAIITCRQSLALAPHSPQGWSMLGLLSERDGDIHGAIEAYEKTLQLSPGSVYERESLQRLRQKRGAAPRPAPKFNFDAIGTEKPQVPSSPEPVLSDSLLTEVNAESYAAASTDRVWSTFYFRSLPVLIAVVVCLGVILVAQRVAANRQINTVQVSPVAPVNIDTNTAASIQPAAPQITPDTLAPPATPAAEPTATTSSETVTPSLGHATPAPVSAPVITPSKPKAVAKPKPKPKAAAPSEMPVLPRPRLNLPNSTPSTPAVSDTSTTDNTSDTAPTIGGGPVDVGNSSDSKYIRINPPRFPNANR